MSPRVVELLHARLVGQDGLFTVRTSDGVISSIQHSSSPASPYVPTSSYPTEIETWDLEGKHWVGPGLRDAHTHFSTWSLTLTRLDLSAARSATDVAQSVLRRSKEPFESPSQVLVGRDFRVGEWPDIDSMTKEFLDEVVLDRPVALMSSDLHFMWLNTAGLKHVGLDPSQEIGVLYEKAAFAAMVILNKVDDDVLDAAIEVAATKASSIGVTSIVDFEMVHNIPQWTRRVQEKNFNRLRVHCGMYEEHIQDAIDAGLKSGDEIPGGKGLLTVGSYKIITDGSLGARTAYCCEPYPGTQDHGLWIYPTPTLHAMATYGTANSLTLAIHAIGDLANNLVLSTFQSLSPPPLPGSSIEHAQLVSTDDFHLFAKLSLIASVQPEHLNDDKELCARYWSGRLDRAFAFKTLEDSGATIRLGSDAPVAQLNPWGAMAAAISRERPGEEGMPGAAWHPEQRLSGNEVAWFSSTCSGKTSIAEGDLADLIVLPADPLKASAKDLRAMADTVQGTMLGGEWTYRIA
ncbi:hypothetical protein P7C70_g594, partial [Phenoliferia sp. Uapishka_3]